MRIIMNICKIHLTDENKTIEAVSGINLKEALDKAGYYFPQTCGGKGRCGLCRVKFHDNIPSAYDREVELLGGASDLRLACMHRVDSDIAISIPPVQEWYGDKSIGDITLQSGRKGLALAGDIGTTTIAVYLVDLKPGSIIAQKSFLNPQAHYGADVMTRLELAGKDDMRLKLHRSVTEGIGGVLKETAEEYNFDINSINRTLFAGNSVMTHLFLGWGGEGLEKAPFRSPFEKRGFLPFNGELIGLYPVCRSEMFPILSSFIGGDTAAGIIAAGLHEASGSRLFIDLGTNGEIVLLHKDKMTAVSTAAGPAFEGAGMFSGMPAVKGAIEGFDINGSPVIIGGGEPVGICGSGYISGTALMLDKGILQPNGLLQEDAGGKRRWKPLNNSKGIYFTQDDIRKFQLAKGAVSAGIEILLKEAGLDYKQLDEIIITGSFGSRINPIDAVKTGILPDIDINKIRFLDNAAGRGAVLCLVNPKLYQKVLTVDKTLKVINLGEHPAFEDTFIKALSFPG